MKIKQIFVVVLILELSLASVWAQELPVQNLKEEIQNSKTTDKAVILVYSNTEWSGEIQDGNYVTYNIQGSNNDKFLVNCGNTNTITYSVTVLDSGSIEIYTIMQGNITDHQAISESGAIIKSSVSCTETISIMQTYLIYAIAIIIAIAVTIILILKKKPISGPRKFRT